MVDDSTLSALMVMSAVTGSRLQPRSQLYVPGTVVTLAAGWPRGCESLHIP